MGKNQEGQQGRHPGGSLIDHPARTKGRWNILWAAGRSLTIALPCSYEELPHTRRLENTTQQRGLGGLWSVWKMISWCTWWEPTRERALWTCCLWTEREFWVGVEGCLMHSSHEMTEFLILAEWRGQSGELLPWNSRGNTLACLGDWLRESLGKKSCRTKESRKAAYSAGRNTKKFRHRIIMPHMPNNQGIRLSQYRFMKGRSYLINLIPMARQLI